MASRSATFHGGYSGALLAPFRYLAYLTLLLAGLLLAAWVIDAFLVFKIWPDGMQPLEVAIATTAAAVDGPYGIPILRAQGVAWAKGLYHALFVASAIEQIITADPQQLTPFDQTVQRFFVSMLPALQVAMLATKLYGLRLALWLSAIVPVVAGLRRGNDRWPSRAIDPPLFRREGVGDALSSRQVCDRERRRIVAVRLRLCADHRSSCSAGRGRRLP